MNKLFQFTAWFTILSAIGLLLLLGYWLLYPYKTIEFKTPFPVANKVLEGGAYISYKVDYCKHTKVVPTLSKYFVDSLVFEVPEGIALNNPLGCHTNQVSMYIPRSLPPGEYFIKTVYHYQINPVRAINVIGETEPFTVK
jgi:hypothetical protein